MRYASERRGDRWNPSGQSIDVLLGEGDEVEQLAKQYGIAQVERG